MYVYDCCHKALCKVRLDRKGLLHGQMVGRTERLYPGKTHVLLRNITGTYPIEETSIGLLTAKMQPVATIKIYLAAYPLNACLNCATKLHIALLISVFFFIN